MNIYINRKCFSSLHRWLNGPALGNKTPISEREKVGIDHKIKGLMSMMKRDMKTQQCKFSV